jgi:hypothetical protein
VGQWWPLIEAYVVDVGATERAFLQRPLAAEYEKPMEERACPHRPLPSATSDRAHLCRQALLTQWFHSAASPEVQFAVLPAPSQPVCRVDPAEVPKPLRRSPRLEVHSDSQARELVPGRGGRYVGADTCCRTPRETKLRAVTNDQGIS